MIITRPVNLAIALAASSLTMVDGLRAVASAPDGPPSLVFALFPTDHSRTPVNMFACDPNQKFSLVSGAGIIHDTSGNAHRIEFFKAIPITYDDVQAMSQMLAIAVSGPPTRS